MKMIGVVICSSKAAYYDYDYEDKNDFTNFTITLLHNSTPGVTLEYRPTHSDTTAYDLKVDN